jgi:hypothetical protein
MKRREKKIKKIKKKKEKDKNEKKKGEKFNKETIFFRYGVRVEYKKEEVKTALNKITSILFSITLMSDPYIFPHLPKKGDRLGNN